MYAFQVQILYNKALDTVFYQVFDHNGNFPQLSQHALFFFFFLFTLSFSRQNATKPTKRAERAFIANAPLGLRRKALPTGHCARLIRPSGHTKAITMASVDTPWVGLSSGDPSQARERVEKSSPKKACWQAKLSTPRGAFLTRAVDVNSVQCACERQRQNVAGKPHSKVWLKARFVPRARCSGVSVLAPVPTVCDSIIGQPTCPNLLLIYNSIK